MSIIKILRLLPNKVSYEKYKKFLDDEKDEIKNNSTLNDGYITELAHKKFLKIQNFVEKENTDLIRVFV